MGTWDEICGEHATGSIPGQALGIAKPEGMDGRIRKGVVGWNRAVGGEAQNLADQGVRLLGKLRRASVARRHVQHAVRAELDTAAVTLVRARDVVEKHTLRA